MAVKLVAHMNFIGHEINESLENDLPTSDREVFCKKLHKITEPNAEDCEKCSYFENFMMGNGHCCVWEDVIDINEDERIIPHDKRNEELLRVSQLIDEGVIRKG